MTDVLSVSRAGPETGTQPRQQGGMFASSSTRSRTGVLHVIAPGDVGGAESVVRVLATAQRSLGARVEVAAIVQSKDAAGGFLAALRDASIETHRILVGGRDYRRERRMLAAICEASSPDIVHSHGYRADVVDALHLRRDVPIVSTVHGFTGGDLRNRLYQWLQCRAYRRFDAVVAVSEPLRRQLAPRIGPKRLHVVPNAYAPESESLSKEAARVALGLPNDEFLVGWVGRLSREKGPDVLLDALARREMPASALAVFVGEGPLAPELRQRTVELRLDARVTWKGRVANASHLLAAFDVLVVSSRTEGGPMVVLEAMATGTPIVATQVGGVPDMLPRGTALLVSPESPSELAAAIRDAFMDPEATRTRARAARRRLDAEYGLSSWAERYEAIYQAARRLAAQRLQ